MVASGYTGLIQTSLGNQYTEANTLVLAAATLLLLRPRASWNVFCSRFCKLVRKILHGGEHTGYCTLVGDTM